MPKLLTWSRTITKPLFDLAPVENTAVKSRDSFPPACQSVLVKPIRYVLTSFLLFLLHLFLHFHPHLRTINQSPPTLPLPFSPFPRQQHTRSNDEQDASSRVAMAGLASHHLPRKFEHPIGPLKRLVALVTRPDCFSVNCSRPSRRCWLDNAE